MPSDAFICKAGDTGKPMRVYLEDLFQRPQILTNCLVFFSMRRKSVTPTTKIDEGACSILDENTGLVQYDWQPEDVDEVGIFQGLFHVQFSDGSRMTFPSARPPFDYNLIYIQADI